ncbi:hypothetical protein C8034_v012399 [Colletotrichum sidae]|uniref:Uncharacterized protein n=1 Tax=Colletotrichum sidae TaxID=1347389 RepID=A0A4R8TFV5_9PEZI|nr:hypothetical protein C8034_v012399 [Colletotrichum sidae]
MKPQNEDQQPFLGFRDDPTKRDSESINDEEHGEKSDTQLHLDQARKTSRTRRYLRDFLVILVTSLVWVVVFSAIPSSQRPSSYSLFTPPAFSEIPEMTFHDARVHNLTTNAVYLDCGNSTAEAKAKGCVYETLLNYWVPAKCHDKEYEQEYQDDDTWYAYSDKNLTKRLTREEMENVPSYYTSIDDHVNHCSTFWKKQFWTLFEERRVVDSVITNGYHTEHCADFLKGLYGMNRSEPTFVEVAFGGCWVRQAAK